MNPDNSLPSEGILEPKILLRRFVKAVKHSPIPIATIPADNAVNLPAPFNSVRFLTTAIVSEMSYSSGVHRQVLFTIGLVLFIFIMIINIVLMKILKKGEENG